MQNLNQRRFMAEPMQASQAQDHTNLTGYEHTNAEALADDEKLIQALTKEF